eukprot:7944614-Pyramimonas_sp.AAC.1
MNGGDACGLPLGPSAGLLLGHETCEGCAGMTGGGACGLCQWDLRPSSDEATKRVRGVPK